MEVSLRSNGRATLDDLNSDSSTFRYQLYTTLNSSLSSQEYKGLYDGEIPSTTPEPIVNSAVLYE